MPPNWSITSEELAQSNDNSQPDARSPGKPAPMVKPVAKPAPVARPVAKPTPVARPVAKPKPVAKPVANPKPVAKALTPVQAVADDVCRVTSQHYLKAGLPVAGMAFGSSLQEVVQQNGWRLGKRAEGSRDNGKLLTLHAVMSDWPRESAKRFCWYSNDEDATKVEHPRFTMLLFDNGKLRGIHRRYYYMFDTNDEYEKKHVRQVFQMFGVAKKENTKTGRTPAGQSFISMIHWFPKSLVFLVYTQNSDLALWVFDRQWFKTGLAAHLEEHHAMLLLATKVTKARPRFSPARSRSPASVLPTAKGFKRKISGPKSEGDSWCVEYAPSDSPQSGPRTPSFKLLIPSTVEQMQSKNPFARMRVWNIRFRVEDYDEDLSWALWNTAAGRAGLFGIAFQKLFLRHFPVVTKLEGKNYRTKDGFIANWWNYELYYSPPLPPDPSRGL
jgi:hypothetical protein